MGGLNAAIVFFRMSLAVAVLEACQLDGYSSRASYKPRASVFLFNLTIVGSTTKTNLRRALWVDDHQIQMKSRTPRLFLCCSRLMEL